MKLLPLYTVTIILSIVVALWLMTKNSNSEMEINQTYRLDLPVYDSNLKIPDTLIEPDLEEPPLIMENWMSDPENWKIK